VIVPDGAWGQESTEGRKRVPTLNASASYERAVKLGRKLADTKVPRELLELHDLLKDDPMEDAGFSSLAEPFEAVRSRIVELFREKAYQRGGWGFE
jgi:hypothetical protein